MDNLWNRYNEVALKRYEEQQKEWKEQQGKTDQVVSYILTNIDGYHIQDLIYQLEEELETRYSSQRKTNIRRKVSKKDIYALLNVKCKKCGSTENLEVDHIIPISKDGTNDVSNLQILCKTCNLKKGNRT